MTESKPPEPVSPCASAPREALERENAALREQVRLLMAAENKLYTLQDHLSAQQRMYVRLTEAVRTMTSLLEISKIAEAAVKFVVYGFNYERCAAFLREPNQLVFRMAAQEGYYDEASRGRIEQAVLTGAEAALVGIEDHLGFVCHVGQSTDAQTKTLGALLQLDEYFVFALPQKEGGALGYLAAGNTAQQSRYQSAVVAEGEMLVAFSNLASQVATAIDHVRAYRALEQERELLDQTVADRTRELSEALDTAQEAVRLKSEFLAKVSHELRTPLNSIINVPRALLADYAVVPAWRCEACEACFQESGDSSSESICPDCGGTLGPTTSLVCTGDPNEHHRFLALLQQQGNHLLGLVEDVLDFSRLEAGRMELHCTLVELRELLAEVEATMHATGKMEARTLVIPKLDRGVCLVADRTKLKQVLLNLIGNAVKFTQPSGRIEVRVEVVDASSGVEEGVLMEVVDDGIGIPQDKIDLIFESFRQVDGSHTRAAGGAGLGLAICRQLVEMHQGTISVRSQLGKGSSFRVWWPKDRASPPPAPSSGPSPSDASPVEHAEAGASCGFGRIVVVDDDVAQLSMARKLLEREGYEIVAVSRPEEAVDTIRQVRPRAVLLDIMMPALNGLTILTQLKQDPAVAAVPVIASTAYHYNHNRAVELGALWLPKPWSSRSLNAATIEQILVGQERGFSTVERESMPRQRRSRLSEAVSQILYVEDEDANWEVTELSLRSKYRLVRARDSRETFEILAKEAFDLILMDVQLRGSELDGIQICRALTGRPVPDLPDYAQGIRTKAPIVFVTAYATLCSREDLAANGAQDLVHKPVDFTHLLLVLSRLMVKGALGG